MQPLGTLTAFAERRGVEVDFTDVRAARALQDASAYIRGYTGQIFDAVTDDVITREGSGRYKLLLPQLPVTAVTAVSEIDQDGTATVLETTAYRVDAYGMLRRFDSCVWYTDRDYAITYDHGYDTVPLDIEAACYELAASNYVASGSGAVTQETIGNYAVTYDAASVGVADVPATVKNTLGRYRVPK